MCVVQNKISFFSELLVPYTLFSINFCFCLKFMQYWRQTNCHRYLKGMEQTYWVCSIEKLKKRNGTTWGYWWTKGCRYDNYEHLTTSPRTFLERDWNTHKVMNVIVSLQFTWNRVIGKGSSQLYMVMDQRKLRIIIHARGLNSLLSASSSLL